jgi:cytochrome c oxidase assembly protein subunit 15
MRHSGAGLAIPDFPWAYGRLIPPFTPEALEAFHRALIYDFDLPRVKLAQVAIHFAHRAGVLVVTGVLTGLLVETFRRYRHERVFVGLASLSGILLVVQITLGALTVLMRKAVLPTTAHVAVGALMLATTVSYLLQERKRYQVERLVVTNPVADSREGARA